MKTSSRVRIKGGVKLILLSMLLATAKSEVSDHNDQHLNIYGKPLKPCSSEGMALTGFTRAGYCVDQQDDQGSHHICIDLSTVAGGNFCAVTEQPDWCSSEMPCDNDSDKNCPVRQWCVCQWAFASYVSNTGGCDMIQDVVCEAVNIEAVLAYEGDPMYSEALECLVKQCGPWE